MTRRNKLESMEGEKEKTIPEKLEEVKAADIKSMEDNKVYRSPFIHIEINDLIPTAQEVYSDYEKLLTAQEKSDKESLLRDTEGSLAELVEEIKKMKEGHIKISNETYFRWMKTKIELEKGRLESQIRTDMDNF